MNSMQGEPASKCAIGHRYQSGDARLSKTSNMGRLRASGRGKLASVVARRLTCYALSQCDITTAFICVDVLVTDIGVDHFPGIETSKVSRVRSLELNRHPYSTRPRSGNLCQRSAQVIPIRKMFQMPPVHYVCGPA